MHKLIGKKQLCHWFLMNIDEMQMSRKLKISVTVNVFFGIFRWHFYHLTCHTKTMRLLSVNNNLFFALTEQ